MNELPEWLRKQYPFEPHWLETPGGKLHYVDTGEGHPVLMLHGNPSWSFLYRNLIAEMSGDCRCIAPDHLGCGLSDKPQDYPYRLANHIDNARALVEHLELESFDLVVHDWGGAIGMGLATQMPERVRRIVILNTAAFFLDRIPLRIAACRWPLVGEPLVRGLNGFAWPATWMAVAKPLPPQVKRGFLYPYNNWHNRVAIARFVQDIPMSEKHPSRPTLAQVEEKLPLLQDKPVRIFWGLKDFCFNQAFLEEWQRRFPHAEATAYPEAGHYVLEDTHAETLPAIHAFLNQR